MYFQMSVVGQSRMYWVVRGMLHVAGTLHQQTRKRRWQASLSSASLDALSLPTWMIPYIPADVSVHKAVFYINRVPADKIMQDACPWLQHLRVTLQAFSCTAATGKPGSRRPTPPSSGFETGGNWRPSTQLISCAQGMSSSCSSAKEMLHLPQKQRAQLLQLLEEVHLMGGQGHHDGVYLHRHCFCHMLPHQSPWSDIWPPQWPVGQWRMSLCWGLNGDMFPVNCSNAIWKIPQFLEVHECLTRLFHNAYRDWESNPVAECNCFVWISRGQKSVTKEGEKEFKSTWLAELSTVRHVFVIHDAWLN